MNKTGILWTSLTLVGGLISAAAGVLTGVASQRAVAEINAPKETPASTPMPETPVNNVTPPTDA